MAGIQTGVDKLIALLHEKKKLSVDEAAKTLGVSKTVVSEWADFLHEEGLLDLKYSLSKTYLVEKILTKQEVQKKEEQFDDQRETFIKRVDDAITQLESETANFESFKNEFQKLKTDLGADLEAIEKEVDELKGYENIKASVQADLHKQHALFMQKQQEAENALQKQYNQYHEILNQVTSQEKKLSAEKAKLHILMQSEESLTKKISAYTDLLTKLKGKVDDETAQLGFDKGTLEKLHGAAVLFETTLEDMRKNTLEPLQAMKVQHDEHAKKLEAQILQKASAITQTAKSPLAKKPLVKKKLEEFFKRKKKIETLLGAVEKDKYNLKAELTELRKRAEAYQLGKTAVRLEELDSKLKTVDARKKELSGNLTKFMKLLH